MKRISVRTHKTLRAAFVVLGLASVGVAMLTPAPVAAGKGEQACDARPTKPNWRTASSEQVEWRSTDSAQEAIDRLGDLVESRFGDSSTDTLAQLARGYIGTAIDESRQELAVVVDGTLVDTKQLQSAVDEVVADDLAVRVVDACRSASDLVKAGRYIFDAEWMPQGHVVAGGDLDAYAAVWSLGIKANREEERRQISESFAAFAAEVDFSFVEDAGGVESGTRTNDSEPHWGGARIVLNASHVCSSGFTVDTVSAGKAILSAGHCGYIGSTVMSGTHGYGEVKRRPTNWGQHDMLVINADDQNYDDDVYMNPIDPVGSPMDVVGSDPDPRVVVG